MKQLRLFIASIALTCIATFPATSMANDDLDVTMDVFDDLAEVDDAITEMRGPEGIDEFEDDGGDGAAEDDEFLNEDVDDSFESDDDFEEDDENELGNEGRFEDGEEVDDDVDETEDMEDDFEDDEMADDGLEDGESTDGDDAL